MLRGNESTCVIRRPALRSVVWLGLRKPTLGEALLTNMLAFPRGPNQKLRLLWCTGNGMLTPLAGAIPCLSVPPPLPLLSFFLSTVGGFLNVEKS